MQRKGEGGFQFQGGSKGFGKGFKGNQYGGKGDGYGGEGSGPIFYGTCYVCNEQGHSSKNCPKRGKGFKANCKGCGRPGHRAAQCPKAQGKGLNMTEGHESAGDSKGLNLGGERIQRARERGRGRREREFGWIATRISTARMATRSLLPGRAIPRKLGANICESRILHSAERQRES